VIRSIGKISLESIKLTARQRRAIPLVLAAKSIDEGCRARRRGGGELIALLKNFYREGEPKPVLPDPEKEIARQRAEGRKFILVDVPYLCGAET